MRGIMNEEEYSEELKYDEELYSTHMSKVRGHEDIRSTAKYNHSRTTVRAADEETFRVVETLYLFGR